MYDGETRPAEHSAQANLSTFTRMNLPGKIRHGYGKIRYESGSTYIGQWEGDKRSGVGTYWFACGDVYDGTWRDGMYQGYGTYTGSESGGGGDHYEGEWEQDQPHGFGRYVYRESGCEYVGQFLQGRRHGKGKLVGANGVKEGEWREGLLVPLWQREGAVYSE